jgi:hypothetical protein
MVLVMQQLPETHVVQAFAVGLGARNGAAFSSHGPKLTFELKG